MNSGCSRNCSSIELLAVQKRVAEILTAKHGRTKHVKHSSQVYSRSPSRGSEKGRCKNLSINYNHALTKSNATRSQSLIDLRDKTSSVSTCVDSINKKYHQLYNGSEYDYVQIEALPIRENSDNEEDDGVEKSVSMSTSLSHITYSKGQETETRSQQYQKLSNAVKRLYSMLENVYASCSRSPYQSQSQYPLIQKNKLPRFFEKDAITNLSRLVDRLTKDLHKQVSHFTSAKRKEKNRLEESQNDNCILKQRLNNSLTIQRNLEGELKELSKEKRLLEKENQNLAIKIVPFLKSDNCTSAKIFIKSKPQTSTNVNSRPSEFCKNVLNTKSKNNNSKSVTMEDDDDIRKLTNCSKHTSMNEGLNTASWYNNDNDDDTFGASQSVSDSNLLSMNSSTEDISKSYEVTEKIDQSDEKRRRAKSREELDSIASYVRWKSEDFNRLHGKLHKSFEELHQLKQTMSWMSQEKSEILADLQDLVESYRELERERDNYESILKLILKEKNSSESNIRELLDGLLVHLSKVPPVQTPFPNLQKSQQDRCFSLSGPSSCHQQHCSNSKNFLESALHVIQEQNISIREEMARLRESLQSTTGQNTLLQENNKTLGEKVNELQKQVESKAVAAEKREKEHVEKFEQLDKLYKTIMAAKNDLEYRLQEKEREIVALNLKTVTEASEKATKEQAEKVAELKEANNKLEREVDKFRASNEELNSIIKKFKADLKDQKGKHLEQLQATNKALQHSKEQCNWLQNQLENFKTQLQDAHERIKFHEKDKTVLAHKVLTADEERKTLDRNIHEIRTVMEADKLYQQALSDRNEKLQLEVNRLRTEKLSGDSRHDTSTQCDKTGSVTKIIKDGDGSGEKRNNNSNSVSTAVKTVNKCRPAKPATPSSSNCVKQPVVVAVAPPPKRKCYHKCAACDSSTPTPTSAQQRTAAAKRLSNALSNKNSRSKYQPRVKAVTSSGRQDSTQTPAALLPEHRRAVVSSHTIRNEGLKNTLLCTAGNRPMVALVRVKRDPLTLN